MTFDEVYEAILLRRAVEADPAITIERAPTFWNVSTGRFDDHGFEAPTLADALTALLRDLGAEVPARPSAERVAEIRREVHDERIGPNYLHIADLRHFFTAEPLTVLALLSGGES